MVTYLPGLGNELAPALSQIGDAVTKALDPDREFRELLKLSIAQKPETLKTLADISINNPDLFGLLGADPKTVAAIKATGPSVKAKGDQKLGDRTISIAEKELDFSEAEVTGLLDALKDAQASGDFASLSKNAMYQRVTNQTEPQSRTDTARATVAESEARLSGPRELLATTQIRSEMDVLNQLRNTPFLSGNVNLTGLLSQIENGEVSAEMAQQIDKTPGMRDMLGVAAQMKARKDEMYFRTQMQRSDEDRSDTIAARQLLVQSKGTGTTKAWAEYNTTAGRERLEELKTQNPNTYTIDDLALVEVDSYQQQEATKRDQNQISQFTLNLSRLQRDYLNLREEGAKEANLSPIIGSVNVQLAENSNLFGQSIIAHPQRKGDKVNDDGVFIPGKGKVQGNKLIYVDSKGRQVSETIVNNALQTPPTSAPSTSAPSASDVDETTQDFKDVVATHLRMYYEQPVKDRQAWLDALAGHAPQTHAVLIRELNR